MIIALWVATLFTYILFRLWYDGLGKPLMPAEVEEFSQVLKQRAADGKDKQNIVETRKFMEEDDGKEFIMVNLIHFNPSPVMHPDTGSEVSASAMLQEYFKPLMKIFLRRAGHPVLSTRAVGGYLESWSTPPNQGWHVAAMIRYRSRRDAMLTSLAHSKFDYLHKYKVAAIKQTFVLPTQTNMGLYASPRLTVALVLMLGAALLQLLFI